MYFKLLPALAAGVFLLAGCGGSGEGVGAKGPVSESRTAAFKSMMPEYLSMGKVVKGEEEFDAAKFQANAAAFAQNARKPFEHFQNDPEGNGYTLPTVWQKPAEFKAEEEKFIAAVDELNAKAQSGDFEAIKAAYAKTGESCKSCHSVFRSN